MSPGGTSDEPRPANHDRTVCAPNLTMKLTAGRAGNGLTGTHPGTRPPVQPSQDRGSLLPVYRLFLTHVNAAEAWIAAGSGRVTGGPGGCTRGGCCCRGGRCRRRRRAWRWPRCRRCCGRGGCRRAGHVAGGKPEHAPAVGQREDLLVLAPLQDAGDAPGHMIVDHRLLAGQPDHGRDRGAVGLGVQQVALVPRGLRAAATRGGSRPGRAGRAQHARHAVRGVLPAEAAADLGAHCGHPDMTRAARGGTSCAFQRHGSQVSQQPSIDTMPIDALTY